MTIPDRAVRNSETILLFAVAPSTKIDVGGGGGKSIPISTIPGARISFRVTL